MANYMSILWDDMSDGPGVRCGVYWAGCELRCEGCWSPRTWNPRLGHEMTPEVMGRVLDRCGDPEVSGLSMLGGDPFYPTTVPAALELVLGFRRRFGRGAGKTVWAWSGYTFDELWGHPGRRALLVELDVLVDGPFVLARRDLSLPFMGSGNQRVIDVAGTVRGRSSGSRETGGVVVLDEYMSAPVKPAVDG